jgi:hypothetical protein
MGEQQQQLPPSEPKLLRLYDPVAADLKARSTWSGRHPRAARFLAHPWTGTAFDASLVMTSVAMLAVPTGLVAAGMLESGASGTDGAFAIWWCGAIGALACIAYAAKRLHFRPAVAPRWSAPWTFQRATLVVNSVGVLSATMASYGELYPRFVAFGAAGCGAHLLSLALSAGAVVWRRNRRKRMVLVGVVVSVALLITLAAEVAMAAADAFGIAGAIASYVNDAWLGASVAIISACLLMTIKRRVVEVFPAHIAGLSAGSCLALYVAMCESGRWNERQVDFAYVECSLLMSFCCSYAATAVCRSAADECQRDVSDVVIYRS